jgi:hypothetical protein
MLANLDLDPLDHELEPRGWALVRYADDCAPRAGDKLMSLARAQLHN